MTKGIGDALVSPWHPMTVPVELKTLGKLMEELGECIQAAGRCLIQGMDECDPNEDRTNRIWLTEEVADVVANIELVVEQFKLDQDFIVRRAEVKKKNLRFWHGMA